MSSVDMYFLKNQDAMLKDTWSVLSTVRESIADRYPHITIGFLFDIFDSLGG